MNKIRYVFFIIILNTLLFQDILQQNMSIFKWADEGISLFLIIVTSIIFILNYKKLSIYEILMIFIVFIFFIIGIYEHVTYSYQEFKVFIIDFMLTFKWVFMYLSTRILLYNVNIFNIKNILNSEFRILTVLIFVIYIINIGVQLYPIIEIRSGIPIYKLFYSQPTIMVAVHVSIISILSILDIHSNRKYIYINLILISLTMRDKGFAFILIFMLFIIKNIKPKKFIIVGAIVSIIALPYIEDKIFSLDTTRGILNYNSIKIAKDKFPLGAGFGTYGSYMSGKYYSPIYYEYGMSNVHGITIYDTSFVSDTFWPMILAQHGVIGLILSLLLIILLILNINKLKIDTKIKRLISIPIIYLLITSTSESSFVHYTSVCFLFIVASSINSYIAISKQSIQELNLRYKV